MNPSCLPPLPSANKTPSPPSSLPQSERTAKGIQCRPLLRAYKAERLAAAAAALVDRQDGRDPAVMAKELADSARAFAESSSADSDAAARLVDAAAFFTKASAGNAPLLRPHNAEQLAAAAAALAADQNGCDLVPATAKALYVSARAFADSGHRDAAAMLADAAAVFTEASAYHAPRSSQIIAAAQVPPGRHDRAPAPPFSGYDPPAPLSAQALGTAAALLVLELQGTDAGTAREFAERPADLEAAASLANASHDLAAAAVGTLHAARVSDLLLPVHIVLSCYHPPQPGCFEIARSCFHCGDNQSTEEELGPTPAILADQARRFLESAANTSMAEAVVAFSKAAENFVSGSGEDKHREIRYSELSNAGNVLCNVAIRAPESEFEVAVAAVGLTEIAQIVWISEYHRTGPRRVRCWSSWLGRLRAAISGPDTELPIHMAERQAKLIAKRQVLFGIALGTPVALLISAVAAKIFPSEYAPWIGGVTVLIWVAVSAGMVANQFGMTSVELQAASHLSRLGMLGLSVLLAIYAYWAFFPSSKLLFWAIVVVPLFLHGCLWIASCIRGDDRSLD